MTLSAYLMSKSIFDVQDSRALTFALARLSCYTFLAGCAARWTIEEDTSVQRGEVNPADSVEDCLSVCINNASCNGVDWNPEARAGRRCWLSGPWSGPKLIGIATDITHYNIIRNCTGKLFYNR